MKSLQITYLEQSCFMLQTESSNLLIDPGKKKYGDITGDIVVATHKHYDHTNGINIFLEQNPEAVLICNEQVAKKFKLWQDRIVLAISGEEIVQEPWKIRFINGRHGLFSKIQNTGVLVQTQSTSFWHAGDSIEFQGFVQDPPEVLAIPIGGIFTASPKKALKELQSFSEPLPTIIPMHWLWRNPHKFCKKLQSRFPGSQCIVPEDGELVFGQTGDA